MIYLLNHLHDGKPSAAAKAFIAALLNHLHDGKL
jgi:hypothetical protein